MSRRFAWRRSTAIVLLAMAVGARFSGSVAAQSTGTISTVAGGGPAGGGLAVEASLRGNVKVVSDAAGNLYVSDGLAHRVYRRDAASGALSVLAGDGFSGYSGDGGPAATARLANPYGLALDEAHGRLYVADIDNSVVRAIELASGLISTVAGTGTCGYSGDNGPAASAQLCNPNSDLALHANGTLYFATDFGGPRIRAVENGVIRTVAGNGLVRGALDGPGGDPADDYLNGVPATTASLGAVTAVAADTSGAALYFYEQSTLAVGGARIRRVDLATGTLTTYAGNGLRYGEIDGPGGDPADDLVEGAAALQSALGYTTSMAVAGGDLYAAVYTHGLVRRVSSVGNGTPGTIVTVVGGGASLPLGVPPLDAGLTSPTGVSLDANGRVYVSAGSHFGDGGGEVYGAGLLIDPVVGNGWFGNCGDGGLATAACLRKPTAARLDPAGHLIVADDGNQRVRSVSPGGIITSLGSTFFPIADLWPLAAGQFLFSSPADHTVYLADAPYTSFTTFAGTGTATGSLDGPGGDPIDDLNDGELAWVASLNAPAGLLRDAQGNTFVADSDNHRVRRIDAVSHLISTVAGTGLAGFNGDGLAATATDLNGPHGLAFATNGDLLVSERSGHRVRRISAGADGLVTGDADETASTVAGTGVPDFSGDGGDAALASLHTPSGLAVDVLGNLYIADTGSRAVRRIDPQSGLIETIAGRGTEGDGGPAVSSQLGAPVGLSTAVINATRVLDVTDSEQHRVRRIQLGPAQPPTNRPPVVDPLGLDGVSVTATSPAGARLGLYANASDPDGDPLGYSWTGPFGTLSGLGVSALFPIGVSTVTVAVDDGQGHVVSRSATVTVLGANTFNGSGEVVTPPDDHEVKFSGETAGRITVTFLGPVTTPGLTWFRTRTDQTPPPPAGKQLGSAPFYYDVATTAIAGGEVRICLDLTGMSFAFPSQVELHRLAGAWNGLGSLPDPATHSVCTQAPFAQVFGTYANFTPGDTASLVVTIAGDGQAQDAGDGGPATLASLNSPEGLAFDAARHVLYIGEASHRVRRVNLATGVIDTIAGTGAVGVPVDGVDARLSSIGSIAGLALDADGHLFIGDQSHCLVRRVDVNTNLISTVGGEWRGPGLTCGHAGDGGLATAARLGPPRRLAFDAQGHLLVVETPFLAGSDGGYVRRIAAGPDGRITGADPAETIVTVAGNGAQDIFVADGVHPLDAGLYPWAVAPGPAGGLYVAESNGVLLLTPGADGVLDGSADERVTRVFGSPVGFTAPFQGDGGPARNAYSDFSSGIEVLPSGDLLVTSATLRRMRRISGGADGIVNGGPDETIVTIAGFSDDAQPPAFNGDGYALSTRFAWPVEPVFDGAAAFFVADAGFHRIRRVGLSSGGGGAASANLSVAASTSTASVRVGDDLTLDVSLANAGPNEAPTAQLTVTLPSGLEYVSDSTHGACSAVSGQVTCNFSNLVAGSIRAFTLGVRALAAGTHTTTFVASSATPDPSPSDNTATVSVVVAPEPLVLLVTETILVTDAPTLRPSLSLNVAETVVVTDTPTARPSVMLHVPESILVTDTLTLTPSLRLHVPETIVVTDTPTVVPAGDTTPPTLTLDRAPGQADPTRFSPITFSMVFSEPVTGFDVSDVSFAGSTVGGTLVAGVSGSGASYTVAVTGMSGAGTVVVSIPAGAAVDAAGNPSAASTNNDNSVAYDALRPRVTIDQAAGQADPTRLSPIQFTVVFDEPVMGFTGSDVFFAGSSVGGALAATVTGSGPSYTVSVTGMTGMGLVVVSIPAGAAVDVAGNASEPSTSRDRSVRVLRQPGPPPHQP